MSDNRVKFLADRLAVVLTDLVLRDMDYPDPCFDDFYSSEDADVLRKSRHYQTNLDLIRSMVRKHDEKAARRG